MNYKELSDGLVSYGEKVGGLVGTLIMTVASLVLYVGFPLGLLYIITALILSLFGIML